VQGELQQTPSTHDAPVGHVPEVVHAVPIGTVATTSIVAVIVLPIESVIRTVSIPTMAPAV